MAHQLKEIQKICPLVFSTPDWSENIDCSGLSLDATNNNVLSAQSQSTKEIFQLIVPSDSSVWALPQNITKHAIGTETYFQLNQSLPLTKAQPNEC